MRNIDGLSNQTRRILAQYRPRYADPKRDARARIADSKSLIKELAALLEHCQQFDPELAVSYDETFGTLSVIPQFNNYTDDEAPALRLNPVTGDLYILKTVPRQIPGIVFDGLHWRSTTPDPHAAPAPDGLIPMMPVYLVVLTALLDAMPVREEPASRSRPENTRA